MTNWQRAESIAELRDTMKIAATIVLLVAALCVVDGMSSKVSIGDTIKSDFLNLDPPAATAKQDVESSTEVIEEGWVDTVRRQRTRRQSRFN